MRVLLALPRLLRVSLSAGLTLGLSGCVRDQPYQLHAPAPPATLANLQDGTEISPKLPVTIPKDPREDKFAEPNVVTLEFSEKGRLFGDSCDPTQHGIEANCQLHRALKYIAEIESSTPATTRLVLLTYVHGNHHNASWSSRVSIWGLPRPNRRGRQFPRRRMTSHAGTCNPHSTSVTWAFTLVGGARPFGPLQS
jgi:hypothetical protein